MNKNILNDELDFDVVRHLLNQYLADLPTETAEILLEEIKAIQEQKTDAIANLIKQFQENKTLDRLYERALRDLRQNYGTQQRTKSLNLTVDSGLEGEFIPIFDDLIAKIEQLLNHRQAIAINATQTKILKALNKYLLTIEDLAYTIGESKDTTQTMVESLWKKGYIDYLKSPILYIIFPGLRSRQYRQSSVFSTAFLRLTRRGYFHLYPMFKGLDKEAIA